MTGLEALLHQTNKVCLLHFYFPLVISPFAHSTYALTLELVMDAEAAGGRQRSEWSRSRPCSNSALVQANVIKRQITNVKVNCGVRDAEGLPQISPPSLFPGLRRALVGREAVAISSCQLVSLGSCAAPLLRAVPFSSAAAFPSRPQVYLI